MTKSHNTQFQPGTSADQRLAISKVCGANSEPRWNEASNWKTPSAPSNSIKSGKPGLPLSNQAQVVSLGRWRAAA